MPEIYLGLMSGTSLDGVDAVLADFEPKIPQPLQQKTYAIPTQLRDDLLRISTNETASYLEVAQLDISFGHLLADIAVDLLARANLQAEQIIAIGSHGHTLAHRPNDNLAFSLQIGNAHVLNKKTGITVVADFRPSDIAVGGQGAPFACAFHDYLFKGENLAIVNIGGISNTTLIRRDKPTLGYDSGPGNCLMDSWIQSQLDLPYDDNGEFASRGQVNPDLLKQLLRDDYFSEAIPKTTGRDKFNLDWLQQQLKHYGTELSPEEIQTTLLQFTIETIAAPLLDLSTNLDEILICGGGSHNQMLMQALADRLNPLPVSSIDARGVGADWVEALAFAWLAKMTLSQQPGNLPSVTGAREATILGGIFR
ncbi:MAG TPA: anhydro-N-acetylmuramic acid kinase [Gammaproteobacteria bacterium]|nr:anhydro-N-acetylmuramic acid kinase [Gammaproteobacteria bacterium]